MNSIRFFKRKWNFLSLTEKPANIIPTKDSYQTSLDQENAVVFHVTDLVHQKCLFRHNRLHILPPWLHEAPRYSGHCGLWLVPGAQDPRLPAPHSALRPLLTPHWTPDVPQQPHFPPDLIELLWMTSNLQRTQLQSVTELRYSSFHRVLQTQPLTGEWT